MSTRLTLIVQAPTTATRLAAFPNDEILDGRGLGAAKALAGRLPRPQSARTSPARSARATAQAMGLDAMPDALLADADYGRWAGRTFDEIAIREPQALAAWMSDPSAAPHGGESLAELLTRAGSWLDLRRGERGHTVAVTHAAIVRAAVVHVLGAPPASFWRIDVAPLSLTEVRPNAGRWTLRALGWTPSRPAGGRESATESIDR